MLGQGLGRNARLIRMSQQFNDPEALRLAQLRAWLTQVLGSDTFSLAPASADASFRRYFRLTHAGVTRIVMDAPPPQEDCAPFVRIAGLLAQAGVNSPDILAQDLDNGFLLLEDLGAQTYLDVLTEDNADALFQDAIKALVDWQAASRAGVLPDYDATILQRELNLFPDWYLHQHLGVVLDATEQRSLRTVFNHIIERALAQPRVYVHRDYMPRNLMLSRPNPGVLDFQDALYGPVAYDVLSLFKDAFISWPQAKVDAWTQDYWRAACERAVPVPAEFSRFRQDVDWIGVHRHLKVLGIFARIRHRDGKPQYLEDAPRFLNYLRPVLARYTELAPLADIIQRYCLPPS